MKLGHPVMVTGCSGMVLWSGNVECILSIVM
jgi:hypothetical protein